METFPNPLPRLTFKCLDDLKIVPSPIKDGTLNMSDIDHPLIKKAVQDWKENSYPDLERIKAIDDNVFFKCKPNVPWRGAIWLDKGHNILPWLVAAGPRQEGSLNDFYASLELDCQRKLKKERQTNSGFKPGKKTYSDHLLPTQDDYNRLTLEIKRRNSYLGNPDLKTLLQRSKNNLRMPLSLNLDECLLEITSYSEESLTQIYLGVHITNFKYIQMIPSIVQELIPGIPDDDWGYIEELPSGVKTSSDQICILALLEF